MAKDQDEMGQNQDAENEAIKVEAEAALGELPNDDVTQSISEKRKLTYYSLVEHLRWFATNQLLISDSAPAFRTLIQWFDQNHANSDLELKSSSMYRLAHHNIIHALITWEKLCKDQEGLTEHADLMQTLHFRELAGLFSWQIRINELVALEQQKDMLPFLRLCNIKS